MTGTETHEKTVYNSMRQHSMLENSPRYAAANQKSGAVMSHCPCFSCKANVLEAVCQRISCKRILLTKLRNFMIGKTIKIKNRLQKLRTTCHRNRKQKIAPVNYEKLLENCSCEIWEESYGILTLAGDLSHCLSKNLPF